jgi:hypothetical protein
VISRSAITPPPCRQQLSASWQDTKMNDQYSYSFETHIGPVRYSAATTVSHDELVKLGKEAFVSHLHRSGNSAAEAALRKEFKLSDKAGRDQIPFGDLAKSIVEEVLSDPKSYPKASVFANGAAIEITALEDMWEATGREAIKFAKARAILQGCIEAAMDEDLSEDEQSEAIAANLRRLAKRVNYAGVGELAESNEAFLQAIHNKMVALKP